jgi:hypothetical protein
LGNNLASQLIAYTPCMAATILVGNPCLARILETSKRRFPYYVQPCNKR